MVIRQQTKSMGYGGANINPIHIQTSGSVCVNTGVGWLLKNDLVINQGPCPGIKSSACWFYSFFCWTWPRTYSAWYQCFRYPENTLLTGYRFHKIQYTIYTPMGTSHTYLGRLYIFHSFFHPFFFIQETFIKLGLISSFALKVK